MKELGTSTHPGVQIKTGYSTFNFSIYNEDPTRKLTTTLQEISSTPVDVRHPVWSTSDKIFIVTQSCVYRDKQMHKRYQRKYDVTVPSRLSLTYWEFCPFQTPVKEIVLYRIGVRGMSPSHYYTCADTFSDIYKFLLYITSSDFPNLTKEPILH